MKLFLKVAIASNDINENYLIKKENYLIWFSSNIKVMIKKSGLYFKYTNVTIL